MKVNYKSDFELTIQLTAGGVDIAAPSWDWQLRFYTFDRQAVYTVAHIDGKAERCAVNTDGTITAYFDKHGLMPGALRCEFVNLVPDSHYTHDTQMQVDPVELGVELWRGASDGGMDAVTLELAGQVLAEVQALAADLQQKAESGYFDGEPGPQGPQGPPGPAGPGLLVVTVTGSDQEALTADHTAAEILAAHNEDRPVVAVYDGEVYQLASVSASLASFSLASADLEVLAQIDVDGDGHAVRIFDEVQGALTAGDGITIDGTTISAPSAVPFVVTLTPINEYRFTPDKTFAEASAAYAAGSKVLFSITQEGITLVVDVHWSWSASGIGLMSAMTYLPDDGGNVVATFVWNLSSPYVVRTQTTLQPKLTAGSGITIANNVISADIPDGAYIIDVDMDADPMTTTAVFADALAAFESGRQVWFAGTSGGDLVFSVPVTFNYGGAALVGITWIDNEQQIFSFTAKGVIYGQVTFVDTTALSTALQSKADKAALRDFCPIIEDTRTAAVSEITGVAPFATLQDGQRVLLKLVYNSGSNSTLNLTLPDGTTTGAIPIYVMTYNAVNRQLATADARAGGYIELVYNESGNRWQMVGYKDMNTTYDATNSTAIKQGTLTGGYLVSPAVLRECFYIKDEVQAKRRVVDNSQDASVVLAADTYNQLGTTDAPVVTLPASYTAADEFLYSFTCATDACVVTLPQGVVLADCCDDFSEVGAGVWFQVSIMDGVAAYLCVTPQN